MYILKKPPIRLEDMNTMVSSSGYLYVTFQTENPNGSYLSGAQ
jgi:hypothetical protein